MKRKTGVHICIFIGGLAVLAALALATGPLLALFAFVAIFLIPLSLVTLFTALVEGIPLSVGLRVPYRRTLRILLAANAASFLARPPVDFLNGYLYTTFMPGPLAPYFRAYPLAAVLGALIVFAAILLVEGGIIAVWRKKQNIGVGWKRLLLTVFIMNAMTFAVFAPLNYLMVRPTHGVKAFTDDSSWAQHPLAEICYTAPNGGLCAVMTDGSNPRTVSPDTVEGCRPAQGLARNVVSNEYVSISCDQYTHGITIVERDGNRLWRIADNPGLLGVGNRRFGDICLLDNGQEFVFSESKGGIYLVNIAERKVGLIVSGDKFFTLTPRYQQEQGKEDY